MGNSGIKHSGIKAIFTQTMDPTPQPGTHLPRNITTGATTQTTATVVVPLCNIAKVIQTMSPDGSVDSTQKHEANLKVREVSL